MSLSKSKNRSKIVRCNLFQLPFWLLFSVPLSVANIVEYGMSISARISLLIIWILCLILWKLVTLMIYLIGKTVEEWKSFSCNREGMAGAVSHCQYTGLKISYSYAWSQPFFAGSIKHVVASSFLQVLVVVGKTSFGIFSSSCGSKLWLLWLEKNSLFGFLHSNWFWG